jgi:hypothetical protein
MNKDKCATCSNSCTKNTSMTIIDGINVCNKCISKILTIFIYKNNIKWLCPYCDSDIDIKCQHCDIDIRFKNFKKPVKK